VTAKAGKLPFLLYCRHGTLELYVGATLMLVQTTVYGVSPQASGKIGFAMEGSAGTQLKVSEVNARVLDLRAH
jgi:hypothetical protein